MFKVINFLLISLILMCHYQKIAGDCCYSFDVVSLDCYTEHDGWYYCLQQKICEDGTEGTPYCGYGACNIVGCNCAGGCRRSTAGESPIEIYKRTLPSNMRIST